MRYFVFICLLFVAAPVFAQTQGIQGDRLAWDQPADSLAAAQIQSYHVALDGAPAAQVAATCAGGASPFTCSYVLPALATGNHTSTVFARVTLQDGRALDSLLSELFTFSWFGPPGTPGNQRLLPAAQGVGLVAPPPAVEPALW